MGFSLTARDYVEYLKRAAAKIAAEKDYITELDAATGDGDHWANMNSGFTKLTESAPQLETMNLESLFKKAGMITMSSIGGSSGVLYGSAYLAAAKRTAGLETLDCPALCDVLEAMLHAIMDRGNAKPGFKTMIDALSPAVAVYREGLDAEMPERELLAAVKDAALKGAESTKNMEAVRGRACYQTDKGVGHIDPGAVTMSYQIAALMDFLLEKQA